MIKNKQSKKRSFHWVKSLTQIKSLWILCSLMSLSILLILFCGCMDFAVRRQLVLADSLCIAQNDSFGSILSRLSIKSASMKESDKLYFNTICKKANALVFAKNRHTESEIEQLLNSQELVLRTSAQRSEKILTTIIAIFFLLFLVSFGLALHYAILHKRAVHKQQRLSLYYEKKNTSLKMLKEEIHNRIFLNDSCNYRIATSKEQIAIRKRYRAMETQTKEEWIEFQTMIDCYTNSFCEKIASVFKLSDYELRVCLLVKAKFKPSEIAVLTAHSKESVCSTRRRLYKKITGKDGTPEMFDSFIENL